MGRRKQSLATLAIVLLVASATAQSDNPIGGGKAGTLLLQTVEQTDAAADTTFRYAFELTEPRDGYVKIVPTSTNPAYDPDGAPGWQTRFELETNGSAEFLATTAGNDPIELGRLHPATSYVLLMTVHAPAGTVATPGDIQFNYGLSVYAEEGTGTGAKPDPTISMRPVLRVVPPPPEPPAENETVSEEQTNQTNSTQENGTAPPGENENTGQETDGKPQFGFLDALADGGARAFVSIGAVVLVFSVAAILVSNARRRKAMEMRLARMEHALGKKGRKGP